MATPSAGKPFDRDLFCKLVLLMDSPNEFERNRATDKAVQMCTARGLRFCDMAGQAFGQGGKRVAELEAQLEQARRGGDELADELRRCEASIAERDEALAQLREAAGNGCACRGCERKELVILALVIVSAVTAFFCAFPPMAVPFHWTAYTVGLLVCVLMAVLFHEW